MFLASSALEHSVRLRYFSVMFMTFSYSDFICNSGTLLMRLSGETTKLCVVVWQGLAGV